MRKFWGYISNEEYAVGCTGQTVFVYDREGKELAKFKDIKYGCMAMFSPDGKLFVVKSTGAYFGVYLLDTLRLIYKVKFSDVDGSQDDGYCFSADGKYFYNIERQKKSFNGAISVYTTSDFKRAAMFLDEDKYTEPSWIETGTDVEGKASGIETELVKMLGSWGKIPVTYAGGVGSFRDLDILYTEGQNRLHVTIGSALDLFGGTMAYEKVLEYVLERV